MADNEETAQEVPEVFRHLYKLIGSGPESVFEMLINKKSPEEALLYGMTKAQESVSEEEQTDFPSVTGKEFGDIKLAMSEDKAGELMQQGELDNILQNILSLPTPRTAMGDEILFEMGEAGPTQPVWTPLPGGTPAQREEDVLAGAPGTTQWSRHRPERWGQANAAFPQRFVDPTDINPQVSSFLENLQEGLDPNTHNLLYPNLSSAMSDAYQSVVGMPLQQPGDDPASPYRMFPWNPYGPSSEDANKWEFDKDIAKSLHSVIAFKNDILSRLGAGGLKSSEIRDSLTRLQKWSTDLFQFTDNKNWLMPHLDGNQVGRIRAGKPKLQGASANLFPETTQQNATAFNNVVNVLDKSPINQIWNEFNIFVEENGGEEAIDKIAASASIAIDKEMAETVTSTGADFGVDPLDKRAFDAAYRDQTNQSIFMNEFNQLPGSGTVSALASRNARWNTAETAYLLGQGLDSFNDSVTLSDYGQAALSFPEEFKQWSRAWLSNPEGMVRSYLDDPNVQGLGTQARRAAQALVDFEKDMGSVYGGSYNEWMTNPASSGEPITEFYAKVATDKMRETHGDDWIEDRSNPAWKNEYNAAAAQFGKRVGSVGLFHPHFAGTDRRWRNLYRLPNMMGLSPYHGSSIGRVLDQMADYMLQSGMTHGEVARRLTMHPTGRAMIPTGDATEQISWEDRMEEANRTKVLDEEYESELEKLKKGDASQAIESPSPFDVEENRLAFNTGY